MPYRAHKAYSSIKRKNQQLRHLRDSGFLLLPVPRPESVETGRGEPRNALPRSPPEAKHRSREKPKPGGRSPSGLPAPSSPQGFHLRRCSSTIAAATCCQIRSPAHPEAIKNTQQVPLERRDFPRLRHRRDERGRRDG